VKFGDVMVYPPTADPDRNWLFMHIGTRPAGALLSVYQKCLTLRVHPDDDLWKAGEIHNAAPEEFVIFDDCEVL